MWNPTIPGQYKITATFAGDQSYGKSWSTTYAVVSDAPAATATPIPLSLDTTTNSLMMALIVGVIAIIMAIAIVGLVILRSNKK
jgi:hypothetical protein